MPLLIHNWTELVLMNLVRVRFNLFNWMKSRCWFFEHLTLNDLCHDSFDDLHTGFKAYVKFEFELKLVQIHKQTIHKNLNTMQIDKTPKRRRTSISLLISSQISVIQKQLLFLEYPQIFSELSLKNARFFKFWFLSSDSLIVSVFTLFEAVFTLSIFRSNWFSPLHFCFHHYIS